MMGESSMERVYTRFPIGHIMDDMQIIEYSTPNSSINTLYYKCRCIKCGRIKLLSPHNYRTHSGTFHQSCSTGLHAQVDGKFYSSWRRLKSEINPPDYNLFVDFYDDLHESYQEAKNKSQQLRLEMIDRNKGYARGNLQWTDKADNTRSRKILAISPDNDLYYIDNLAKFGREHDIDPSNIRKVCNGNGKQVKDWRFCYLNGLSDIVVKIEND